MGNPAPLLVRLIKLNGFDIHDRINNRAFSRRSLIYWHGEIEGNKYPVFYKNYVIKLKLTS
jgi:hypothetical protein